MLGFCVWGSGANGTAIRLEAVDQGDFGGSGMGLWLFNGFRDYRFARFGGVGWRERSGQPL